MKPWGGVSEVLAGDLQFGSEEVGLKVEAVGRVSMAW